MNLGVVGGGSGGHVTPIASFLRYLRDYRKDDGQIKSIVWFGESDSMEQKSCESFLDVKFQTISSGKMRRYWNVRSTLLNLRDFGYQIYGFFQALYFLRKYHIDVLFCKGGYVALGVSSAAYILQIPIVVHESDTVGGLTNRIVHKLAKKSLSGFDQEGYETIGQLLSLDLLSYDDSVLKQELQGRYDPTKTCILVMGGSQGSQVINDHVLSRIDNNGLDVQLTSNNCQIILLLGTKNAGYKEKFAVYDNVRCFDFLKLQDVAYCMSIADIALTRSSATSVAEQKLFGLCCVYIPLPFTGGNHQYHNAVEFCKQHPEDMLLEQKNMEILGFNDAIKPLLSYKKTSQEIDVEKLLYPHVRLYEVISGLAN